MDSPGGEAEIPVIYYGDNLSVNTCEGGNYSHSTLRGISIAITGRLSSEIRPENPSIEWLVLYAGFAPDQPRARENATHFFG